MFTCAGHKNWVLCIAWSPDGKYLVSGSKAGEFQCWDPQTGKPLGSAFMGHKKWITGISWEPAHLQSPCRRFVSSSKDGDARIWDVTLRKCVMCLSGHTLAVTCVKWGGDGVTYTRAMDIGSILWHSVLSMSFGPGLLITQASNIFHQRNERVHVSFLRRLLWLDTTR